MNCSKVAFNFNEIEDSSESDVPFVIYKYFDTPDNRDNFLNGWVWFSGSNQNRFFSEIPDCQLRFLQSSVDEE